MTQPAIVGGCLTFQEAMSLISLPDKVDGDGKLVKRYMSRWRPWVPGRDLLGGKLPIHLDAAAFGGHVYSQAGMAASRAFLETRAAATATRNGRADKQFGIHTIHGYFSEAGLPDRPFFYDVSTVAANPSFVNLLVTARQPTRPSSNPAGDPYPTSPPGDEPPLGPVRFTALVSLRPAGLSQLSISEIPAQQRFADVLSSRAPSAWPPAPNVDIAAVMAKLGSATQMTTFPGLEMRKVDLSSYNAGRALPERRELILYRLLAPLKEEEGNGGCDAHILAHAYGADRNGLLMVGNHAGFGYDLGRAASLSYSFVVHVNPADAVMAYSNTDDVDNLDEWWVQEACFPRVEAGRAIIMSKIWSPAGVHVATMYQDGILRRNWRPGEREGKL
ncbi:thioesterase-like superfamily-domain-containing protein [Biscogniauxia mediterranea]|nr:thioesterase-like superfamily-domain-containing protein [Biscogniauxia mediterranea]